MDWNEFLQVEADAKNTISLATIMVENLARLCRGRLRHVDGYTLSSLKRELRDFNMQTREWKDKK